MVSPLACERCGSQKSGITLSDARTLCEDCVKLWGEHFDKHLRVPYASTPEERKEFNKKWDYHFNKFVNRKEKVIFN